MNIGIDEAGRGALAGPLVVAGVSISLEQESILVNTGLSVRDSKVLSEIQREKIFQYLCDNNIYFVTEIISTEDINANGIGWANYEGIKRVCQKGCVRKPTPLLQAIVDGRFPLHKIQVKGMDIQCIVDADATIFPVILAGIVAKVTRDRIMNQLHRDWNHFGWDKNKGYGTAFHIQSLREYPQTPYHRQQFVATALSHR